ncbi:hypothetical protein LJC19_02185 [Oxalobacter sp. OttesenSCG-928-P03]|nr:hypothetical protein [Oxalobacter sp. OttesenSCG-928-P03]
MRHPRVTCGAKSPVIPVFAVISGIIKGKACPGKLQMEDRSLAPQLSEFGKRIEKLLYTGVTLMAFCIAGVYFVIAAEYVKTQNPVGFRTLAGNLEKERGELQRLYDSFANPPETVRNEHILKQLGLDSNKDTRQETFRQKQRAYERYLVRLASQTELETGMRPGILSSLFRSKEPKSPGDWLSEIRKREEELASQPIKVWGIETPLAVPLQYGQAQYAIPLSIFSVSLQIILVPLLIVWMSSLYMTRQRELLLIRQLDDYKFAQPHMLNILPIYWMSCPDWSAKYSEGEPREKQRGHIRFRCSLYRSLILFVYVGTMFFCTAYSYIRGFGFGEGFNVFSLLLFLLPVGLAYQSVRLIRQEWSIMRNKDFST